MLDDLVDLVKLRASAAALGLIFEQRGETLSGDLRGHEHFGFKDGISQPGVRGKLSAAPGDYITPRYISAADSRRLYLAKPGQQLVWPGQFLLGEPRQSTEDQLNSAAAASNFPNGPTAAVSGGRRLQQDVRLLTFCARALLESAVPAKLRPCWWAMAEWCAFRVPARQPALAMILRQQSFHLDDDARPSSATDSRYPVKHSAEAADFLASCPHFEHIRKVQPRDTRGNGKPADSFASLILRRGIHTDRSSSGVKYPSRSWSAGSGLMFLSYGDSTRTSSSLPTAVVESGSHPIAAVRPIIGQNGRQGSRCGLSISPLRPGVCGSRSERGVRHRRGLFFAPE